MPPMGLNRSKAGARVAPSQGEPRKKKPIDLKNSMDSSSACLGRSEKIQTSALYVPNAATYQTNLAGKFFMSGNQLAQQR